MLRVALVGHGYWGANLRRVIEASERFDLWAIVDPVHPEGQESQWGLGVASLADAQRRWGIEAAVIATPAPTHVDVVLEALELGLHVLVTKPLATSAADGEKLQAAAEASGRVLMVDHTYLYSPHYAALKVILDACGGIDEWTSIRTHDGGPRDVSSLWDLLPHDLAMLHGLGFRDPSIEMIAGDPEAGRVYLTDGYRDASIEYSRRHPSKERSVRCHVVEGPLLRWSDWPEPMLLAARHPSPLYVPSGAEPLAGVVDDFADACAGLPSRYPVRSTVDLALAGIRVIEQIDAAFR